MTQTERLLAFSQETGVEETCKNTKCQTGLEGAWALMKSFVSPSLRSLGSKGGFLPRDFQIGRRDPALSSHRRRLASLRAQEVSATKRIVYAHKNPAEWIGVQRWKPVSGVRIKT